MKDEGKTTQKQKVCLIIPERPYLFQQKSFPHLGILTVADALKKSGHDVVVFDFADDWRYVRADWYAITCTTADWFKVLKINKWLKGINPKSKVIVGGSHATYATHDCEEHFDFIAVGDGEISVLDIIDKYNNGEKKITVIGYETDIDKFHPDRDAININYYEYYIDGIRATSMVTALSCAYGKCSFCSRPPYDYNKSRFHSYEWCVDEIDDIWKRGFKAIMIYDDEFMTNTKRDMKIISHLGYKDFIWRCFVRSDYVIKYQNLLRHAAQNGLKEVLIGIESGSDTILSNINKGTDVKTNYNAIKLISELGIKIKAAMIVGLPGESKLTVNETWKFCEEIESYIFDWDFTTFTPLPGSDIYDHPEKYDIHFDKLNTNVPYKSMNSPDSIICPIQTKDLSFEEILSWRQGLESRFKLKHK